MLAITVFERLKMAGLNWWTWKARAKRYEDNTAVTAIRIIQIESLVSVAGTIVSLLEYIHIDCIMNIARNSQNRATIGLVFNILKPNVLSPTSIPIVKV
jgi:hypothetical protein